MKQFQKFLAVLLLFWACTVFAQRKQTIAVIPFKAEEQLINLSKIVTDQFRAELFNLQVFHVIDQESIDEILSEQKIGLTGVIDTESSVKVGKLLAAQKLLTGSITTTENEYILTVNIVDVETRLIHFSDYVRTKKSDGLVEPIITKIKHFSMITQEEYDFFYVGFFSAGFLMSVDLDAPFDQLLTVVIALEKLLNKYNLYSVYPVQEFLKSKNQTAIANAQRALPAEILKRYGESKNTIVRFGICISTIYMSSLSGQIEKMVEFNNILKTVIDDPELKAFHKVRTLAISITQTKFINQNSNKIASLTKEILQVYENTPKEKEQ